MAGKKVTFTLDAVTARRLQDAADRLAIPESEVLREAILQFHNRSGRLSERERLRMLRAFDALVPKIPSRSLADVKRELSQVRKARKQA
jgi:hypothetical protein